MQLPKFRTKRSNWLLVHRGDNMLRVADVNAHCESPLVQECHSMVFGGKVFTFLHTVLQVHESSIRIAAKKTLEEAQFEVMSFKNARCAFQYQELRDMALHFKNKSRELVSTWQKGSSAGFFFGSLVKKLDPALKCSVSWADKRNELESRIQELESERNFYKQKYEALAEQFLHAEF
jgi:DNA repair exonuclease SbcCD ATPase subunit